MIKRYCTTPRCPNLVRKGKRRTWLRKDFLLKYPWCANCAKHGRRTQATVVDHIKPHRGDPGLLRDVDNLQPLCTTCHASVKQSQEVTGRIRGCRSDGTPLDPAHPWNSGSADSWTENVRRPHGIRSPTIPVTMVCGPPAAWKSSYVNKHRQKGDLVIDLDLIMRRVQVDGRHPADTDPDRTEAGGACFR